MKTILIAASLALSAVAASAAERQAKIEVGELTCPSCPYIAASALKTIDSVRISEAIYDAAAAIAVFTVTYDDAATTLEEIARAPDEYGYPGRVLDSPDS